MHRLFGLLAGAIVSFITTWVSTQKNNIKERHPRMRTGICNAQCRLENHVHWESLPEDDPRSPVFLSYLESIWLQDLEPGEAIDALDGNMEKVMFDYASLLLDDLVERGEMLAHEAEHLRDYYRAIIFRTIAQR